jgi:hypothetical protein
MTTLNLQVSAGSDDGSEAGNGTMSIATSTASITSANAWLAYRVQATIPIGSTIDSAIPSIWVQNTTNDSPAFNIHCQAIDDAPALTTAANDISSRTRTTNNANWTGTDIGASAFKAGPDIKDAVQEVVDRAGRAETFNLMTIWDAQTGVSFGVRFFEFGSNAPKLDIDYTAPAAGQFMTPNRGYW